MHWRGGKGRQLRLLGAGVATALIAVGCAKPQGPLFGTVAPGLRWPAAPERPRIAFVGTLASSDDLHAAQPGGEVLMAAFRGRRPPIRFSGPQSVDRGPGGLLAVADTGGAALHILHLTRRTHSKVIGWGGDRLEVPVGVTWAGRRLFVTDSSRHEVIEFDSEGGYRRRFGRELLSRPAGIVYVPAVDRLYVVDAGGHRVEVFDPAGGHVTTIGRNGTAPGEFNFPTHISWDGRGSLLVSDTGNFRVQLLDLDGNCLKVIGRKGDAAGDFALPKGVAFDSEGHLYVVDAHFENVQVFDRQGRLLLAFGEEGDAPGRFSLPAGLAIDGDDRVWVADSGNRRIQAFAYLRDKP